MIDRTRWLVMLGTQLGATKREHYSRHDAVREIVDRFYSKPGYKDDGTGYKRWHGGGVWAFGWDRLAEISRAWPLTAEREAAYNDLVAESKPAARKAAVASIKAQAAFEELELAA